MVLGLERGIPPRGQSVRVTVIAYGCEGSLAMCRGKNALDICKRSIGALEGSREAQSQIHITVMSLKNTKNSMLVAFVNSIDVRH